MSEHCFILIFYRYVNVIKQLLDEFYSQINSVGTAQFNRLVNEVTSTYLDKDF